jgi:protease I
MQAGLLALGVLTTAPANELRGKHVAILVTDGFEQVEMTKPRQALLDAGATVDLVSLKGKKVQAMQHDEKGDKFTADKTLGEANASDYDAIMLPGGVANPDKLRISGEAVAFVKNFVDAGKPIAAICHGPWTLIEAGGVRGKTMTSWPSLKTDLTNAGATWIDREVVVDGKLVTSRKPDDIPAFNAKMIADFAGAPQAAAR